MTPLRTANWPLVWTLVFMLVVLLEGIALGEPQAGDSLSEAVALLRWDAVGRWVMIPLWVWLTWHWMLRPRGMALFTWRDVVALAIGTLLAALEAWRRVP